MENKQMTALVGSIQKFSTEDGPGIRTTVFLKGCPLNCAWCHNPELIDFEQEIIEMPGSCIKCGYCLAHCPQKAVTLDEEQTVTIDRALCDKCMACTEFCYAKALRPVAKEMTAEEILQQVAQDKGFYENTGGGMTISGGEMLARPAFAERLVDLAAEQDISVCLDTSGFGSGDWLEKLARKENVTHVLYDMKSLDEEIHLNYTGRSNAVILENLRRLCEISGVRDKVQMRMPLISGINDSWDLIKKTAAFYRENGLKRVTLLPYHNLGVSKQKHIGRQQQTFSAPEDQYIEQIKLYFEEEAGMEAEILGKL